MAEKKDLSRISRRDFVKISAVAGALLAGGGLTYELTKDCSVAVRDARVLMGTIVHLTVIAESKSAGIGAIEAVFAEMEDQIGIFDHRSPKSPVSILNQEGILLNPPSNLVEVLKAAIDIGKMSVGAFDVTIKPLVDAFHISRPVIPSEDQIQRTLQNVDYRRLIVSEKGISFSEPGMAVTLDGIAKGYVVDAGAGVLKSLGYQNIYVEAGGDLMTAGKKENSLPWRIGLGAPRSDNGNLLTAFYLQDQAVATSGDYIQAYSPDFRHHHIIDPRTGYSSRELASVTVTAPSALQADALATAVMVIGESGIDWIESLTGCEVYAVRKDNKPILSSGFGII